MTHTISLDMGNKAGIKHCFRRRKGDGEQSRSQTPMLFLSHL